MKKLNELFDCEYDILIKGIKINSKEVEKGDLFVCTKGITADRHDYIDDAIERGASAVVVSRDVGEKKVPVIKVPDTNKELPYLLNYYKDNFKLITNENLLSYYNDYNNLPKKFEIILRKEFIEI